MRRHLRPEQRALLDARVYAIKEKKQGKRTDLVQGMHKVDVLEETAKELGIISTHLSNLSPLWREVKSVLFPCCFSTSLSTLATKK